MQPIEMSGLFINPIAFQIRQWNRDGKIDEGDLDRWLTSDGRALVDHALDLSDWVPLDAVEGLVSLASEQLGGDASLVEWAADPFAHWLEEPPIARLLASARGLVDGPGFLVSQLSGLLIRDSRWQYEGGRSGFSVRLASLACASPGLKSLVGALLARVAGMVGNRSFDLRFEGIDGEDALVVFGEPVPGAENGDVDSRLAESRLYRAALVGGSA